MSFAGFPAEGFQFLNELRENNDKAWFEENKARYLEHVQKPAIELVISLGSKLNEAFPSIQFDTAVNGSGTLMRIYRDTRFSKDKSPYKTNVAMMFNEGGKKMNTAGFGLQITPDDAGLMAGLFGFDKEQLSRYRDAVASEKRGKALTKLIKEILAKGDYKLEGQHYKTTPRTYDDPQDERSPLLLHNGLWISLPSIPKETVMSGNFTDFVFQNFKTLAPVQIWLKEVLG